MASSLKPSIALSQSLAPTHLNYYPASDTLDLFCLSALYEQDHMVLSLACLSVLCLASAWVELQAAVSHG